jgi:hypothetical protein
MKPIANQRSTPNEKHFLRRVADRLCDSRRERILREMEHHRHLFDSLGIGPIG